MEKLSLKQKHSLKNISKVAYISYNYGGVNSSEAFKSEDGLHININYDSEYINKWGWDMSEALVNTRTLTKEEAMKVIKMRKDLGNIINLKKCK